MKLLREIALTGIVLFSFLQGISQTVEKRSYKTGFTNSSPEIDGLMNDSCWNQVEWGNDFTQIQPKENITV